MCLKNIFCNIFYICPIILYFVDITLLFFAYVHFFYILWTLHFYFLHMSIRFIFSDIMFLFLVST